MWALPANLWWLSIHHTKNEPACRWTCPVRRRSRCRLRRCRRWPQSEGRHAVLVEFRSARTCREGCCPSSLHARPRRPWKWVKIMSAKTIENTYFCMYCIHIKYELGNVIHHPIRVMVSIILESSIVSNTELSKCNWTKCFLKYFLKQNRRSPWYPIYAVQYQ